MSQSCAPRRLNLTTLVAAILFALACASALVAFAPAKALAYNIYSTDDFIAWRNNTPNNSQDVGYLKADITITDSDLDRIQEGRRSLYGKEALNGNEYGITLNLTRYPGLFTEAAGSVRSIHFHGEVNYPGSQVGAVAGTLFASGKITNCVNYANITGKTQVGGLAGRFSTGNLMGGYYPYDDEIYVPFSRCANHGTITATDREGTNKESSVGGIVGYARTGYDSVLMEIQRCYNVGAISAAGKEAGGIAGTIATEKGSNFKVRYCFNLGTVHSDTKDVAGIVAHADGDVSVSNCYNKAELTADKMETAHGIVHWKDTDQKWSTAKFKNNYTVNIGQNGMDYVEGDQNGKIVDDIFDVWYELDRDSDGVDQDYFHNGKDLSENSKLRDELVLEDVGEAKVIKVQYEYVYGSPQYHWTGSEKTVHYGDPIPPPTHSTASTNEYTFHYFTLEKPFYAWGKKYRYIDEYCLYDSPPEPWDVSVPQPWTDLYVYAYFTPNPMTVYFDPNLPEGMTASLLKPTEISVRHGFRYGDLPSMYTTSGGYGFGGWYDKPVIGEDDEEYTEDTWVNKDCGSEQTLYAHWYKTKDPTYVVKQPADITAKLGDAATFSVEIAQSEHEKETYPVNWYKWYRGGNPDSPEKFKLVKETKTPEYTIDPVTYGDGNSYYFCKAYFREISAYSEVTEVKLITTQTAKLTIDLGPQIEASVDTGGIKLVPDSAEQTEKGITTFEYDIPVNIKFLEDADLAHTVEFDITIPQALASPKISSYTYSGDEVSKGKVYQFTERVRLYPGRMVDATVDGECWKDGGYAELNEISIPIYAPQYAEIPDTLAKPALYAGGIPDDFWGATPAALPERVDVGSDVLALTDMVWDAGFDPSDADLSVEWQYSADGANWIPIEWINTKYDSRLVGDRWQTRAAVTFKAGLTHNTASVRAVVRLQSGAQPLTSESSTAMQVAIATPTNISVVDLSSSSVELHWNWDENTGGVPTDGATDGDGFLITYSHVDKYNPDDGRYYSEFEAIDTVDAKFLSGTSDQSKTLSDLLTGNEYQVTVQAYANGELGPKSDPFTFTTKGLSQGEYDINPRVAVLGEGEKQTFQACYAPYVNEEITDYQWFVSTDGETWTDGIAWDKALGEGYDESGYSYTLTLKDGGPTYVYCKMTINGDNDKQIDTPVARVLNRLKAPTELKAEPQSREAKLSWRAVPGENEYLVRYTSAETEPESAQDPAWHYSTVNGTTLFPRGFTPNTKYHWQVAARTSTNGVLSEWTECTWETSGEQEKGTFTTAPVANVGGAWTVTWDGDTPASMESGAIALKVEPEDPEAASKAVGKLTYSWEYYDEQMDGGHWVIDEKTEVPEYTRALTSADYGRKWCCVVVAKTAEDSKDSYWSNSVTPTFYPPQVENLTLSSTATTMQVSWPLLESVDAYEITYRASGDDPAAAKTIRVSSQDSSETLNHYSVAEGQATYTLEGLAPDTNYHVSIVGSKLGEQSESEQAAETRTLPAPAVPTIAEQPSTQFADMGSTGEITFTAALAKPEQGEFSAQLERYVPGADGAEGTWEKAADVTIADDESVEGIARLTAVLTPSNETSWRYVDAARLRFSVTNSLNGATTTAQSDTANLVILSVQPSVSVVEGSTTMTSVGVELDGTFNGNPATNRFTLYWTDDATLSTTNLAGWKSAVLDADENGHAFYVINNLTPGATCRILALSTPAVNDVDLPPSKPSEVVETTTIRKNTLTAVTVTPERTVAQDGTTVELSAVPTFDGEGAKASYVWQWYTADEGWQDIPDAADAPTYTATVGEANASAYRCIMTTGGALNPAMEEKSVTSNRAVIWNDARPHDPADLNATPQVRSVELSWTGDDGLVGSYVVEYRVAGDKEWRTIYSDVASCSIVDLEPSTTYEWRVTAKSDNGLTSATVDGSTFATLTGSVLTNAQMTPSKTDVTMEGDWKSRMIELSVRDDADSAEEKDYTWQYSDDGGDTWEAIEGEAKNSYKAPVPTFVNNADEECVGTRLYRCIVTATVNGDTAEVASSTASVSLVPSAPTDANLVDAMQSTAGLTWMAPASAVPCGYEVEYRKQGASDWASAVVKDIKVAADGTVSCRMVALKSSTAYEWRVRAVGIPAGTDAPDPAYASAWTDGVPFATPPFSGLNTAIVTPQVALYDPADKGAVRFEVKTDVPYSKLDYEWQWQETSANESEEDAWNKVKDYAPAGQLVPNEGVLEVTKAFRDSFPSARFRCVVTTNDPSLAEKTKNSSSALMVGRLTAPHDLEAKDVSLSGANLKWADDNRYAGTYTLQYRAVGQPVSIASSVPGTLPGLPLLAGGQSLFTSIDSSGWMTVSGIKAKEYSFTDELVPGTTYEWRVWFVSNAGGVDGPVSDGPVFTTPESSALQGVVVTPKVAVGKAGDTVTFTAVTNVDASEKLGYQWYTAPRGSQEFQSITDETRKQLTVSVGEDDLGTQYRCEVSATKNGDPKKVTSEPVSVWKLATMAEPASLQAIPTATTANLSWTCDNAQMAGTFTVEYRASDGVWQTVNNVEGTTLQLTGLKPNETYKWRVAHVVGDETSKFVPGEFTTLEGSALTSVTVTPASVTIAPNTPTRLIATTNAEASEENLSYWWQQLVEPGGDPYWDYIHTEDAHYYYYDVAGDQYDISSYRCVVTAEKNGDVKTITSAEVQAIVAPEAPIHLLADGIETNKAQLSWSDPGKYVETKTHEVAWRVQGENEWSTALMGNSTHYVLTDLEPSTTYEWRVRTTATDQSVTSEWSDISSFITLGESDLSEAVVAPVLLRYDTVSGEDAKFEVSANAENLNYQWQWKPAGREWDDAKDTTKFAGDNGTVLTVKKDFAQSSEAQGASFQCIVSTRDGVEPITVTSNPAVLMHRVAAPTDLDTSAITTSSATFSWNDTNTYEGAYTLQYRPSAVSTKSAAGGENWTTVSEDIVGDGADTITYTMTNLNPDTIYEWRVRFVTELGGVEGAWAEDTFRTLPGSAIKWVEVSPTLTVGEAQDKVGLQAATNVDYLPGETLAYQWQTASRGSNEWTNVEGGTNATLTVTVGDADAGVRYRCMVTATKNGYDVELASNEAVVWTRFTVAAPDNLAVSNLAMTGATLSWTCDQRVEGTFEVAYRAKGAQEWTVEKGLTAPQLVLDSLTPATEYEWQVKHVVAESLASEFVAGDAFTTKAPGLGDMRPNDPSNLQATSQTARAAELSWTGDKNLVGSYTVEYRALGSDTWSTYETNGWSCVLSNLQASTTYEWRVTAEGKNSLTSTAVEGPAFATKAGSALTQAHMTPSETVVVADTADWMERTVGLSVTDDAAFGETREYVWECSDDNGATWEVMEGVSESSYDAPVPVFADDAGEKYVGTQLYRCTVTASVNGDKARVVSSTASVRLEPPAPTQLASSGVTTGKATLSWVGETFGLTCGYEVQYLAQGTNDWTTVSEAFGTAASPITCTIEGLSPGVTYEWRVRAVGVPAGQDTPSADYASAWADSLFVTLAESGLSKAVVTPPVATFDAGSTEPVVFEVKTDADSEQLKFTWQWQEASAAEDAWQDVSSDANGYFQAEGSKVSVQAKFLASDAAQGARFRCVVETAGAGVASKKVESTTAVLQRRLEAPSAQVVAGSAGLTSAQLSWTDANTYEGTYTLEYRAVGQPAAASAFALRSLSLPGAPLISGGQSLATSTSASGWQTIANIARDASGTTTYLLEGLAPNTAYEWRVKFVAKAGGVEGPVANGPAFTTLAGSSLDTVQVTPKIAVGEVGQEVTFTATTNVDNAGEVLAYQWETAPYGSTEWKAIDGETGSTLKAVVADSDTGVQYRCVVTATKNTNTQTVTSDSVSLWKKLDVAVPADLDAEPLSVMSAKLSWTCDDAKVLGTFTVEYCGSDGVWHTVRDIAETTLELSGLKANETYQWRVSHVVGNGFASEFVGGKAFKTLEGSALSSVTVTPSSGDVTYPAAKVTLTAASNAEASGEDLSYQWQAFTEAGSWENIAGATAATYDAPAPATYGSLTYRCVVTAQKNGDVQERTSAEAVVNLVPQVPGNLGVGEVATNAATLSWTEPQAYGEVTYEVAWRASGATEWTTQELSETSLALTGLDPSTIYEWRVRTVAVADGALVSEWTNTASFVTLSVSGLTTATVTPASVSYDTVQGGDVVFTVQTDTTGETFTYQWQWKSADGAWQDVAGENFVVADDGTLTVREAFAKSDAADGASFQCIVSTQPTAEPRTITSSPSLLTHLPITPDKPEDPDKPTPEDPDKPQPEDPDKPSGGEPSGDGTPGSGTGSGTGNGAGTGSNQQGSTTGSNTLAPTGDPLPVGVLAGLAGAALATCALALTTRGRAHNRRRS